MDLISWISHDAWNFADARSLATQAEQAPFCTARLTLAANRDSATCVLSAKRLAAGSYAVTAYYWGYPGYGGTSNSAAKTLTITH
jgi:hypothetical protein